MTKIPIVTQNFSSPDAFSDTPLMLLPQAPLPPLPDRDQEGFSQLLLHDLHRHRQSYVRSFTAFEVLKKRQDFVLRQENLRSLQTFEQRVFTKQDHAVDQSLHSYEQCFVKVINGNTTSNGNIHEQNRRIKSAAPAFDKFHAHQLSHIPATPLDPPLLIPFHRYQKSHRPTIPSKHRSDKSIYHSAQAFHDAAQSTSSVSKSQQFLSYTEGYLQKYGDRSANKFQASLWQNGSNYVDERTEDDSIADGKDRKQARAASAVPTLLNNQNGKQDQRSKHSDLQNIRTTVASRNTNTPSSTPQIGYNDALRDGLTTGKDDQDLKSKIPLANEKRRSSQQSASQLSSNDGENGTKRPKTAKRKPGNTNDLKKEKKTDHSATKNFDNDLLKKAMLVQNYGSNNNDENRPSKVESLRLPTSTNNIHPKKSIIELRRSSVKSNDSNSAIKQYLDKIATQIPPATTSPEIKTEQIPIDDGNDIVPVLTPVTNTVIESQEQLNDKLIQQQTKLGVGNLRNRVRKGAFDTDGSINAMMSFDLGMMGGRRGAMKNVRWNLGKENQNGDGTAQSLDNQATLDLLEKIRQSATGLNIGSMPVSQQGCRFELPFDFKLLETLTPLDYLSKYCRLSSRRNHQFRRVFDKYRNNQYRLESSNLNKAIMEIHTENFTEAQFDNLCKLIDIENQQHQFTFDSFAGVVALCERMLYNTSTFQAGIDEADLAKDTIEKCDFDSLERKLDGLKISDKLKTLLKTL